MIKTEYRFAVALKTLMAEVPLDDISVTLLCKKCQVKRQTFYYHFHDIYDLLTLVFLSEAVEGIKEVKNIRQMIKTIFTYYNANRAFIDATMNSACKDLFQEFVYNNCYHSLLHLINTDIESKKLHLNDKKAIARFYGMAFSNSIVYYLSTHKTKTADGLLLSLSFEDDESIHQAIMKYQKRG